jgi:hypothetical protein
MKYKGYRKGNLRIKMEIFISCVYQPHYVLSLKKNIHLVKQKKIFDEPYDGTPTKCVYKMCDNNAGVYEMFQI